MNIHEGKVYKVDFFEAVIHVVVNVKSWIVTLRAYVTMTYILWGRVILT